MVRALDKSDVRERLLKTGYETAGGTPEQLGDYVRSEMTRVGKMIKDVGIKPEP
jgi:tripartite-type tricarboxylate transporter receptor subunit TctC